MPLETVDILIESDDITPVPIDGVVVRVYDATGTTLITSGTTSAGPVPPLGHVEFTLNGEPAPTPDAYQLRFFFLGASIVSPQMIEVYSPPAGSPTGTNNFSVTATLLTEPVATDPLLCRASGFIRDPSGRPKKGLDIGFIQLFNPLVAGGQSVLGERIEVRTNKDGYVELDLFRLGCYQATVESHENIQRRVVVPDRASININHLLFPIVVEVVYDVLGPYALNVGDELVLTPTVTASNFQILTDGAFQDVLYSAGDDTIISVTTQNTDEVVIRALAPGTTTIEATRADSTIVYVPDPGITGGSVSVTVT